MNNCQARARSSEPNSRHFIQAQSTRNRMGGSTQESYRQVGSTPAGSVWGNEGVHRTLGRCIVEWKQSSAKTRNKVNPTNDKFIGTSGRQTKEASPGIFLGSMFGNNNPYMGKSNMVECLNKASGRLVRLEKNFRSELGSMGSKKRTQSILDSVFGSHEDTLWALRTEQQYRAIARKFIVWYYDKTRRKVGRRITEEIKFIAPSIGEYLQGIVRYRSGENINMIGGVLERLFKPYLVDRDRNASKILIKKLKRKANQINPPMRKASKALKLKDLQYMIESPEYLLLGRLERQSVGILLVAFATLSRIAEIAALSTRDVSEDGHYISIRIKTQAATCQRHINASQMQWDYTHREFSGNVGKRPFSWEEDYYFLPGRLILQ